MTATIIEDLSKLQQGLAALQEALALAASALVDCREYLAGHPGPETWDLLDDVDAALLRLHELGMAV